jgi:hypothetical protein
VLLLILVPLCWLAVALFAVTMLRLAAVTDAKREAQLAEWLSRRVGTERRAPAEGERSEDLRRELRRRLHRAAG